MELLRKKKKKKKIEEAEYTYVELLDRVYLQVYNAQHPVLKERRYRIPALHLKRSGIKKTAWTNFGLICQVFQRSTLHVNHFVCGELGTESSTDQKGSLVLKGRYSAKHIESVLKKYINNYVSCHVCQSPETTLSKDPRIRLQFLSCETCNARRSVEPITSKK